jgi:signal transduction histidine kinase
MSVAARLGLRGRTIRSRFTAMYVAVFLLSGVGLLGITLLLSLRTTTGTRPVLPGEQAAPAAARQRIAVLEAQLSQTHAQQQRQLLTGAAVALLVTVAVSALLGRVVAGRVLRPLRTITAATRRITADNLHERLAVSAPRDEVKDLADTIDGLLERLQGAFAAQRLFAANASHELRTPLTTMRAALDVAMAKPGPIAASTTTLAERLRAELDRIDRLLGGLLLLARAQHPDPAEAVTVPLADLVSAALGARSGDIAARNLAVRTDLDRRAWIHGNQALLARMIDNVVDNALIHNHDGGWLEVTVAVDGPTVLLVAETGGPRLDQEQVRGLAQPFHRLGAERTGDAHGSGLGLSIVSAVATAHGGRLDLHARPTGGLRVTIALPEVDAPVGVPG